MRRETRRPGARGEKHGLKRIVRVRGRTKYAAAHAKHHGPELVNQPRERFRVAAAGVPVEQFRGGARGEVIGEDATGDLGGCGGHDGAPVTKVLFTQVPGPK